jgi:glycosyltransferase involved in cell wall biosynthesis
MKQEGNGGSKIVWRSRQPSCRAADAPQWIVARFGANMQYAVPRILNEAGLLARFYTDFYAGPRTRRVLSLIPTQWRTSVVNRAFGRVAPDLHMASIRSYTMLGLEYSVLQRLVLNRDAQDRMFLQMGDRFAKAVARDGFAGAGGFYGYNTASFYALRAARECGLKCVLEQNIAPRAVEEHLLGQEHELFPRWETARRSKTAAEATIKREYAEWELADVILCPSEFVRQGVIQFGGAASKCCVVPYGVDSQFLSSDRPAHDGPLRVLTVGQVNLRKGAGYARKVARMLKNSASFRWVGPILLSSEGRRALEEYVTLTGPIPRNKIFEQFHWADVFFLPSLCEGSATVTYEALMSGLPVVTTSNAGSIVTNGVNGFIVPVRDSPQMAEKLRLLHEDRGLLRDMQDRAVASRQAHIGAYKERLLEALGRVLPMTQSTPPQDML